MFERVRRWLQNRWTFEWRKDELKRRIVWTVARDSMIKGETGDGTKVFVELIPNGSTVVIVVFDERLNVLDSHKFDPRHTTIIKVYGETMVLLDKYVVKTEEFRALVEKLYELAEDVHWKIFSWIMAEEYSDFEKFCGDRLDNVCLAPRAFHKKFEAEEKICNLKRE